MREIGEEVGVTKATVHNILKTDKIKEIVEQGTKDMMDLVPTATKNMKDFLSDGDKRIKQRATEKVLEITGIAPSHSQNHFVQQIYVDNRQATIDPGLLEIFAGHFNAEEAEVVTVEPITVDK